MKIIATIADLRNMPWTERFVRPEIETIEQATEFMDRMINSFNMTLRADEQNRRLVGVTIEPITTDDARNLGVFDYGSARAEAPFLPGELADAWQEGYDAAESSYLRYSRYDEDNDEDEDD